MPEGVRIAVQQVRERTFVRFGHVRTKLLVLGDVCLGISLVGNVHGSLSLAQHFLILHYQHIVVLDGCVSLNQRLGLFVAHGLQEPFRSTLVAVIGCAVGKCGIPYTQIIAFTGTTTVAQLVDVVSVGRIAVLADVKDVAFLGFAIEGNFFLTCPVNLHHLSAVGNVHSDGASHLIESHFCGSVNHIDGVVLVAGNIPYVAAVFQIQGVPCSQTVHLGIH